MNEQQQVTEYLVIARIGGAGDPEVWLPGSKIKLSADKAALHLASGNIRVIETTVLSPEPAPTAIIHEPPTETVGLAVAEESPKKAKGKGD